MRSLPPPPSAPDGDGIAIVMGHGVRFCSLVKGFAAALAVSVPFVELRAFTEKRGTLNTHKACVIRLLGFGSSKGRRQKRRTAARYKRALVLIGRTR